MTTTPNEIPSQAFVVGDNGELLGHIDFDKLTSDATVLMYELANTSGDDAATNVVAAEWSGKYDPDYFGYLCASALTMMVKYVLSATLDVAAHRGVDLRPGLKSAYENAKAELGDHEPGPS